MNLYRAVISIALILLAGPAWGCSREYFTPPEKFDAHQVVVLAYPIGILNKPAHAVTPGFTGPFEQAIQWQVLVSWKGTFRVGDILRTQSSYNAGGPCGSGALYAREVKLLYLDGVEPFQTMIVEHPISSMSDMKYLSQHSRGG
ncbi:hypothetical protein [Luteimonas kalidii]|uniref:Uncharacterized protein n=1 Tax=Luteimonas kalidii TaxID=3042025 RepID=A0ABT6JS51_9GAMM|nr:hypothetical protein [Luteimonas kalidii]MDH5833515.1 hypothetical protein [Luteimonas kalidii]